MENNVFFKKTAKLFAYMRFILYLCGKIEM